MITLINKIVVAIMPYLPRRFVANIAGRYVAGESVESALAATRDLNERGFDVTLDILGEHVDSEAEAADVTHAYVHLYGEIAAADLNANISVKPSHLGLDVGKDLCLANLTLLAETAHANNNFLRIDMESSLHTDITIDFYKSIVATYPKVGLVFQGYLFRTADDVAKLMSDGLNFRICKGIYRELETIAIQDRQAINENYLAVLRQGLEGEAYVAIATHDQSLITAAIALINELGAPPSRFEFQVLYGVPMAGRLEELLKLGYKVRVYVPFGKAWYEYGIRRLKENPAIAGYVMKDLFRRSG